MCNAFAERKGFGVRVKSLRKMVKPGGALCGTSKEDDRTQKKVVLLHHLGVCFLQQGLDVREEMTTKGTKGLCQKEQGLTAVRSRRSEEKLVADGGARGAEGMP